MSWIDRLPPGIRNIFVRTKNVPDDFWIKCPISGQLVTRFDVEHNLYVIPESEYHMQIDPLLRFAYFFDEGSWEKLPITISQKQNPLRLPGYDERLRTARKKTDEQQAVVIGCGDVLGVPIVAAAHDFRFIGGSLGSAEGESLIGATNYAREHHMPLVVFTASGGARMQEGALSLMQMPRVTIALQKLREAGLPYIVVLTNPSMGGVTASYGMLGDVHIAEPGALVGFAGARVVKEVTGEDMPARNQTAEFLHERGMIDIIVHRRDMAVVISRLCRLLMKLPAVA